MENPDCWGKAERLVSEALSAHEILRARGVIGISCVLRITTALREAGVLKEETVKVTTKRTIHIELEDLEARELAASLRNAASVIRTEPEGYATMTASGDYERLLKLATELTNAPR